MLTLTPSELIELTGYRQASAQLAEAHRQGFWRARRAVSGGVILERAHYVAVCQGVDKVPGKAPRLREPELRGV